MHKSMRRLGVSTVALLLLLSGGVAAAESASALVSPQCDAYDPRVEPRIMPPAYVGGGSVQGRCYLSYGSTGNGVRALQRAIIKCYNLPIGPNNLRVPDGGFGTVTRDSLKEVQRRHGITADGAFGPQTRNTMQFEPRSPYLQCWYTTIKV